MSITKDQKKDILQELVDKFSKSKSVVFADYRGLNVAGISELRGKLREEGAEMKIAKKTLINLAAKENKIEDIDASIMEGPVAATFSYEDAMSGIKVLFNFAKENDNLKLLGGVIDGKVVGPEVIRQYALLPGREELLAKFMGSAMAPVSGFVGVMNNLVSGFVRVIDAYKNTLPADGAAPAEKAKAEEPKAEEAKPEEASAEATPATDATETETEKPEVDTAPAEATTEEKVEVSDAPAADAESETDTAEKDAA